MLIRGTIKMLRWINVGRFLLPSQLYHLWVKRPFRVDITSCFRLSNGSTRKGRFAMDDWKTGVYHTEEPEGSLDLDTQDAVFFRDHFCCLRCRSEGKLTVHHIMPRSEGGHDDLSNLMTLCRKCHDYIEGLPLRTRDQIINEPAPDDKRARRRRPAPEQDWRLWVYGGYRNPRI